MYSHGLVYGQANGLVVIARFTYLAYDSARGTVYDTHATKVIYDLNVVITMIWCVEAAARMIAYGFAWPYVGSFWSKAENRLDFAITMTGYRLPIKPFFVNSFVVIF
jgi:hypothetical protein